MSREFRGSFGVRAESRRLFGVVAVSALVAVVVAAGLAALNAEEIYAQLGLPDPGPVAQYGLPAMRVIAQISAAITVGSLLLAAFGIPTVPVVSQTAKTAAGKTDADPAQVSPETGTSSAEAGTASKPENTRAASAASRRVGLLSADGYAAVRMAGWAATSWALAAFLLVPLLIADATGFPPLALLNAGLPGLVEAVAEAQAWLGTAVIALVVAVACRFLLAWGSTVLVFALSLGGLLPLVATGHSASGGAHDLATNSLLFHLVGACLWVGGLVALLAHAARRGAHLSLVARRFSAVALVSWIAMAGSGLVNALTRLEFAQLVTSSYGILVLVKAAALIALGVFGYAQRERGLQRLQAQAPRAFLRLGAGEVLLMFATFGVAVALGRTPPPAEIAQQAGAVESLIGYPLTVAPDFLLLMGDVRFDLVYGTLALVMAGFYLAGVRKLVRRGDAWPVGRTVGWLAGCATILLATSGGIGRYAPAMFSVHMGQHMLLSMLAPALLVLGGPVALALRVVPAARKGEPPGVREWILAGVHSPISRLLTHPVVALALFTGSFFALYFSGLFDAALWQHWAHLAMNAHFLLTGYLFYWIVIGVDPAPRKLPEMGKLGLVFASVPFHGFFGVTLMMSMNVIGESFYHALALPWVPDLLADQRLGGGLAWASGEIPLLVVLVALLMQWYRADQREAARADRRAEQGADTELDAYNAMLRQLAQKDGQKSG